MGGRARLGRFDTAPTIVESSVSETVPPERVGSIRRHSGASHASPSAIQEVVGSKPRIVTDPAPKAMSAAITRSPELASSRPRVSSPDRAVRAVAPSGSPPRTGRTADGSMSRMAVGRKGSSSSGNALSASAPDVPPTMTRRPPPAIQPRRASIWPGVSADASSSCHTIRSRADHAWRRSGRSAGVRGTIVGWVPFWDGRRSSSPTIRPGFSAMTPTTSWVWSWRAMATVALATCWSPLTSSTVMLPPNVGGRAYRRYCLREPVASSTGVPNRVRESMPPAIRSSPVTGGPPFERSTATANQEPERTWPWSRAWASIVRPSAAAAGTGSAPSSRNAAASTPKAALAMRLGE